MNIPYDRVLEDAVRQALAAAAHSFEILGPMSKSQYVGLLKLYAAEPWRLGELEIQWRTNT